MSIFGDAGRFIDRNVKRVTRTVKKVPGIGHALKAGESVVKGPIGDTIHAITKNPVVSVAMWPVAIPTNLGMAGAKGGVQGATKAAADELRNPIRRTIIKGVAMIFPPAAAADKALDASNKILDAAESDDAAEAAKAAAQIGAAEALAADGDPDAKRVVQVLNEARKQRAARSSAKLPIGRLTDLWARDARARATIGAVAHRKVSPARVNKALNILHGIAGLTPAHVKAMNAEKRENLERAGRTATDLVAATLEGATAWDSEFLAELGAAVHQELGALQRSKNPMAAKALAAVEAKMTSKSLKRTKRLNRLVLAYNSRDPKEQAAARHDVIELRTRAERGEPKARSIYDALRRRTAALKKAREFAVDGSGMVRRRSAR